MVHYSFVDFTVLPAPLFVIAIITHPSLLASKIVGRLMKNENSTDTWGRESRTLAQTMAVAASPAISALINNLTRSKTLIFCRKVWDLERHRLHHPVLHPCRSRCLDSSSRRVLIPIFLPKHRLHAEHHVRRGTRTASIRSVTIRSVKGCLGRL